MIQFVVFKRGEQENFLSQINEKFTFQQMSKLLGVSKSMMTFYRKEKSRLSEDKYNKLCQLLTSKENSFQIEKINYPSYGMAYLPTNIDDRIAELVGVLLGDGHLSKEKYKVVITCGLVDEPYIKQHIKNLLFSLFSVEPRVKQIKSKKGIALQCYIYSKKVHSYINETFGVEIGRKTSPRIPDFFFQNNILLKSCLRGLIDTDGGFYRHHKNSCQLCFYSKSDSLANSFKDALIRLGFIPIITRDKRNLNTISLTGKEAIKCFEMLQPANRKNIVKFSHLVNFGRVPNNNEIMEEIRNTCVDRDSNPGTKLGKLVSYH